MGLKLYGKLASPPVRAVLLCVKALEIDVEWIMVDLFAGNHLKPDFLKMNPNHTIPVLDDDGFIVTDSHAILTYLVSKYGKDDSLYPQNVGQRATVDHRLHFDSGILFARGVTIVNELMEGAKEIPKKKLLALEEAVCITEKLLDKGNYIAGNQMTVADFSIVSSITSFSTFIPFSEQRFPKISDWIKRMQTLPYYQEANQEGLNLFIEWSKPLL